MDTTKTTTHIGLCAGYGGIELGLKRVIPNLRSVALCEIEAYAIANLVAKMEAGLMEPAPIWTDLKTFPWAEFRDRVDILTGGYPCQPFSAAGKRLGTEDPRHLWPFIASGIRILRPKLCFFENVEGHISLGLREVIGELEQMGYKVSWGIFSAREVGAPHQRKRVFIMAHRSSERGESESLSRWISQGNTDLADDCGGDTRGRELADTDTRGQSLGLNARSSTTQDCRGQSYALTTSGVWPSRPGQPQHGWEPPRVVANSNSTQPSEGRGDNGEVPQVPAGEWTDECATLPRGEGEPRGEVVGNAAEQGCQRSGRTNDPRGTIDRPTESNGGCAYGAMEQGQRQAEPALGRDPYGTSDRLDYAELCISDHAASGAESGHGGGQLDDTRGIELNGIPDQQRSENPAPWESSPPHLYTTCDNRTDELRLLGNGVVPATAERAFRTLLEELNT